MSVTILGRVPELKRLDPQSLQFQLSFSGTPSPLEVRRAQVDLDTQHLVWSEHRATSCQLVSPSTTALWALSQLDNSCTAFQEALYPETPPIDDNHVFPEARVVVVRRSQMSTTLDPR